MSLLKSQAIGVITCVATAFILSYVTFTILKNSMGLKVDNHEEINGLDTIEHGLSAYNDIA